jgi:hypothetical protein
MGETTTAAAPHHTTPHHTMLMHRETTTAPKSPLVPIYNFNFYKTLKLSFWQFGKFYFFLFLNLNFFSPPPFYY